MKCRGIRGATTVDENRDSAILDATQALLETIVSANAIAVEDVASVIFSVTPDLDAVAPAAAARRIGWVHTPLFCVQEMAVPGSLPRCIRILVHWNTEQTPQEIRHIYLREARHLRPDLVEE